MQHRAGLPGGLGTPKSVSFSDVSDGMSGQRPNSDDEFNRLVRKLAETRAAEPARQARRRARRGRKEAWRSWGVVIALAAGARFALLQARHPSAASSGRSSAPAITSSAPAIASSAPAIAGAAPPVLPFA